IPVVTTGDNRGGPVELSSADPAAPPRIVHRYDATGFEAGWEVLQEVLATRPFARVENLDAGRSLADLVAQRVSTCFPAAGTGAIVEDDVGLQGSEPLSVADASVSPTEVSNNPNLTCHMIGERLAEKLRGVTPPTATRLQVRRTG